MKKPGAKKEDFGMGMEEKLQKIGVVPVVVLENEGDAAPLAKDLYDGGLPCAEVTFRTQAAYGSGIWK